MEQTEFHINKTRATAYRVRKGHDYIAELLPVGETVMAKYPKINDKAAPRCVKEGNLCGKVHAQMSIW